VPQECVTGALRLLHAALQDPVFSDFVNAAKDDPQERRHRDFDTQTRPNAQARQRPHMSSRPSPRSGLPNQAAQRDEYVDGFGLTAAEFEIRARPRPYRARSSLSSKGMFYGDASSIWEAWRVLTVLSGSTDNVVCSMNWRTIGDDETLVAVNATARAWRKGQRRK